MAHKEERLLVSSKLSAGTNEGHSSEYAQQI